MLPSSNNILNSSYIFIHSSGYPFLCKSFIFVLINARQLILKNSLNKRKWFRIKFNTNFLKSRKFLKKKRFLKTYEDKTKKLFRRFFAPGVTNKQFKKLFKVKSRYRNTFRHILKLETRFDTLIYKLYGLSNISLARFCIRNQFFLLNKVAHKTPKILISSGDIIEPANKFIWQFLNSYCLKMMSSLNPLPKL